MQNKTFEKLTERRRELAAKLKDPAAKGLWNMVVDKYSEPAHFIVELLQNADDANATAVEISLCNDSLTFKHNGSIHFSIQDPDSEDQDAPQGHVNALTSIGSTSKKDEAKIGKFGIGFKSVFQYTDRPYIEDDNYAFVIEDYIVPIETDPHSSMRMPGETLFELPLKPQCNKQEIVNRLSSLDEFLPFLINIRKIETKSIDNHKTYRKEEKQISENNLISYKRLTTIQEDRLLNLATANHFHIFSTKIEDNNLISRFISIAYRCTDSGDLIKPNGTERIYCFFPTKEDSNLNILINAPFLLTESRENIKKDNSWNHYLTEQCANLATKGLSILCNAKKIDIEQLFNIVPIKKKQDSFFSNLFYDKFASHLQSEKIFLSDEGIYARASETRFCTDKNLREVFTTEILALMNPLEENRHWTFSPTTDSERLNYLRKNKLIGEEADLNSILSYFTKEFTQKADKDWLLKCYCYLSEITDISTNNQNVMYAPIFLSESGEAFSAYDSDNNPQLFYEKDGNYNHITINNSFYGNSSVKRLFNNLGITKPDTLYEIKNNIVEKYKNELSLTEEEIAQDINYLTDYYEKITYNEAKRNRLKKLLFELRIFPCVSASNIKSLERGCETFIPNKDCLTFYKDNNEAYFLDNNFIIKYISPEKRDFFYKLFSLLGGKSGLKFQRSTQKVTEEIKESRGLSPQSLRKTDNGAQEIDDIEIFGFQHFLSILNEESSAAFFNLLAKEVSKSSTYIFRTSLMGKYRYVEKNKKKFTEQTFQKTSAFISIFETKWLIGKNGERLSPNENLDCSQLSEIYDQTQADLLLLLDIKQDPELIGLTEKQKRAVLVVRAFEKIGINIDQLEKKVVELKKKHSL